MKLAVIGAGLMGRAALFDLSRVEGVDRVDVFDVNEHQARDMAGKYGNERSEGRFLDAGNEALCAQVLKGYQAAVSCVTYAYNPGLTRAAIKAGCHLVDLGGNNDVVNTQLGMDSAAREAGVMIVPDCGLAPGMVSIMVADGVSRFEKTSSIKIRVGGLPQAPRGPLQYQMVFSAEGLLNEYWEPCVILENGKRKIVNPMTAVEDIAFDGIGDLEAFYTSGGTSTLPATYEGKVDFLDYKTIRYPGHCHLFKTMLELGLASRQPITVADQAVEPRALFRALLDKHLSFNQPDLVLVRVTVQGENNGKPGSVTYEIVDRQDTKTGLTAMMRTTAFPAAIVAWMAAAGQITMKGVKPQEVCVNPQQFFGHLKKRGITLTIKES